MKTTGLFTTHKHVHAVPKFGTKTKLIVFGDIHKGSPNHAKRKWAEFLKYAKSQRNAIFLGLGDYIDSASTSERESLSRASLHEGTREDLEQLANGRVNELARELDFMRGRLIGLIGGNHYFQFNSGMNSDNKLSEKLECKFLGVCSLVRVLFTCGEKNSVAFDIFAHHGAGGARLFGGSINRVDQLREFIDADAYFMGHDHKRGIVPANPKIYLGKRGKTLKLKERQQWIGRTGSFLAAYENGTVNYNVDAARGPCSLGWVELEITMKRTRVNADDELLLEVKGVN